MVFFSYLFIFFFLPLALLVCSDTWGIAAVIPMEHIPDTTTAKSLNTFWQNMLKERIQIFDDINRPDKNPAMTVLGNPRPDMKRIIHSVSSNRTYYFVFSSANKTVCVNRTEQNRTEQNRTEQNRTEQKYQSVLVGTWTDCRFADPEAELGYIHIPEWRFFSPFRDFCFKKSKRH